MGRNITWIPFWWSAWLTKTIVLLQSKKNPVSVIVLAVFRVFLVLTLQIFWLLDQVFMPGWRHARIRGPIFIIGHQRSGTTVLHRLLISNESVTGLRLQEMIFPASTIQYLIDRIANWDRRHGKRITRFFGSIENWAFSQLDSLHRMRLNEIEEDEFVMWAIYSSAMCANDTPFTSTSSKLETLRSFQSWPRQRRARVFAWYRACLLKKVQREFGEDGGWIVSKNPAFSKKITEIRELFPGACFVLLVRNPLEAIPSRLSLIESIWKHRFPGYTEMTPEQVENIYRDSIETYLSAEKDLQQIPSNQKFIVDYEILKANPVETANQILDYFKIGGTVTADNHPGHAGRHEYSLDDFSLSKDRVIADLSVIFNRYDFDSLVVER